MLLFNASKLSHKKASPKHHANMASLIAASGVLPRLKNRPSNLGCRVTIQGLVVQHFESIFWLRPRRHPRGTTLAKSMLCSPSSQSPKCPAASGQHKSWNHCHLNLPKPQLGLAEVQACPIGTELSVSWQGHQKPAQYGLPHLPRKCSVPFLVQGGQKVAYVMIRGLGSFPPMAGLPWTKEPPLNTSTSPGEQANTQRWQFVLR